MAQASSDIRLLRAALALSQKDAACPEMPKRYGCLSKEHEVMPVLPSAAAPICPEASAALWGGGGGGGGKTGEKTTEAALPRC